MITKAGDKKTKDGSGTYLGLEMEIVEGNLKGSRLWLNLNLDNPNPRAVDFAKRDFERVKRATGVRHPSHESELLDIPFYLEINNVKKNGQWEQKFAKYISSAEYAGSTPNLSDESPF